MEGAVDIAPFWAARKVLLTLDAVTFTATRAVFEFSFIVGTEVAIFHKNPNDKVSGSGPPAPVTMIILTFSGFSYFADGWAHQQILPVRLTALLKQRGFLKTTTR